jgi:hypothetical protein
MSIVRHLYVSSVGTWNPGTDNRCSCVLVIIVCALSILAYIPQYAFMEVQPVFFSYPAAVANTSDRAANLDLCLAVRVLFRATPAVTQYLGLYGLI